jgi:hypothetical protein
MLKMRLRILPVRYGTLSLTVSHWEAVAEDRWGNAREPDRS